MTTLKECKLHEYYFAEVVRVYDNSEYKSGTCSNGGDYGFHTTYRYDSERMAWKVNYYTTSDFDYCANCGDFGDHSDWNCEQEYMDRKTFIKQMKKYLEEMEENDALSIDTKGWR